jgi:endoglycosylceramidase
MFARCWPALALSLCACSSAAPGAPPGAPTCSLAQPAPPDWRLRTDGTRLRDGLGRIVLLRGMNGGGRSKFAPYMPFDYASGAFTTALAAYMDRAQGWGIDVMRVPFVWAAVEPQQGSDDMDFLMRYDALLDAAWAHGIWTVVDFHQDVYAENFCGDGFPAWTIPGTPPAPHHDCANWGLEYVQDPDVTSAFDRFWADGSTVQAGFASLWGRMAARYKDKPGVLGFEVINEPSPGSAMAGPFAATTLTAFYTKMVAALRAAAPSSLVFVDPLGLDGLSLETTLARPAGDGIVFAPHFYPPVTDPSFIKMLMETSWVPVGASWDVPVFVGEFGTSRDAAGALPLMQATFDALDAFTLGGTEWEYSVEAEEWNGETNSIVAADGTEYPIVAAVLRPFARAVAGDSLTTGFDTGTGVFTLSYVPAASGVTEVSFSARAYPQGYDVQLTGACVDATHPGELLLQADPGAAGVALTVTPK